MDRPGRLPAPKNCTYHGKRLTRAGDMAMPVKTRQRAEDKNDGEIGNLLQRVVTVKAVRLGRQMKRRVMHERVPGLQEDEWRSRHDALPLVRTEEHGNEDNARNDEAVHVDEVPNPRSEERR